jgi:thiol-disulfide isomerase/thioredoxin
MIAAGAALVVGLLLAFPALADDKTDAKANKPQLDAAKFKASLADANELNKFFGGVFSRVAQTINSEPKVAEALLDELEGLLKDVKSDDQKVKDLLGRANATIPRYRERLVPLEEIKKRIAADNNDVASVRLYVTKISSQASSLARSKPAEAAALLKEAKKYLKGVASETESEAVKNAIDAGITRSFASTERRVAASLKHVALIGKDMMELEVDGWVNGSPLTDADLKGKVVVLDFWAVWCGPCIRTFPHLIEWQEKYGDKEFAMIGLTRLYKRYDFAGGKLTQANPQLGKEDELKMLEKFAEHHKLGHRLAIQSTDSQMAKYYGVTGIPHVVVIDKQGKIQMIKVGSGEANAQALEAKIEELLGS